MSDSVVPNSTTTAPTIRGQDEEDAITAVLQMQQAIDAASTQELLNKTDPATTTTATGNESIDIAGATAIAAATAHFVQPDECGKGGGLSGAAGQPAVMQTPSLAAAAAAALQASGGTGNNLMINYIPTACDEDMMREIFSRCGEIEEIKIVKNLATGESRGFGFVCYRDPEHAIKVIEQLDGYQVFTKRLKVGFALFGAGSGGPPKAPSWQPQQPPAAPQQAARDRLMQMPAYRSSHNFGIGGRGRGGGGGGQHQHHFNSQPYSHHQHHANYQPHQHHHHLQAQRGYLVNVPPSSSSLPLPQHHHVHFHHHPGFLSAAHQQHHHQKVLQILQQAPQPGHRRQHHDQLHMHHHLRHHHHHHNYQGLHHMQHAVLFTGHQPQRPPNIQHIVVSQVQTQLQQQQQPQEPSPSPPPQ